MFCNQCGGEILGEPIYCSKCGSKLIYTELEGKKEKVDDKNVKNSIEKKPNTTMKVIGTIGAVMAVIVGIRFGIIGGLLGAGLASIILRKTNTVSKDSVWVRETKALRIAKYIILGLVLLVIVVGIIFYINQ